MYFQNTKKEKKTINNISSYFNLEQNIEKRIYPKFLTAIDSVH